MKKRVLKVVKSFNDLKEGCEIITLENNPRKGFVNCEPEFYRDRSRRLNRSLIPVTLEDGSVINIFANLLMVYK